MSEGYGLVVRFTLRDQHAAEAFDALCARTLDGIRASEPGTLAYVVHRPEGEPLVRVFYELYADRLTEPDGSLVSTCWGQAAIYDPVHGSRAAGTDHRAACGTG
ncbi:putative quinol monooxygenase [Streptomyces sp. enrichment culture]|uniref:putative quinol monooxygenase n=1 Tax=Streptomyces sp. enrichment culture TaxID=1795815 RepID=UPI003F54DDFB